MRQRNDQTTLERVAEYCHETARQEQEEHNNQWVRRTYQIPPKNLDSLSALYFLDRNWDRFVMIR